MWPARPSYHLHICMCSHRLLSAGQNSGAAFNVAIASRTSDASQDLGPSMHSSHFPCHQRQERHCGFRASELFSIGQNVDSSKVDGWLIAGQGTWTRLERDPNIAMTQLAIFTVRDLGRSPRVRVPTSALPSAASRAAHLGQNPSRARVVCFGPASPVT